MVSIMKIHEYIQQDQIKMIDNLGWKKISASSYSLDYVRSDYQRCKCFPNNLYGVVLKAQEDMENFYSTFSFINEHIHDACESLEMVI